MRLRESGNNILDAIFVYEYRISSFQYDTYATIRWLQIDQDICTRHYAFYRSIWTVLYSMICINLHTMTMSLIITDIYHVSIIIHLHRLLWIIHILSVIFSFFMSFVILFPNTFGIDLMERYPFLLSSRPCGEILYRYIRDKHEVSKEVSP